MVFEAKNVVGIIEGTDPLLKDEAVINGAHDDHRNGIHTPMVKNIWKIQV